MSDEYHFDLSDVQPKTAQAGGKKKAASWIMPVLILILLLAILWQLRQAEKPVSGQQLSEEQVLELAQKLENLELAGAAAATWQQYLEMSNPDAEKAAKLWYRIGTIQQQGRLYAEAVASFARSQALCKVDLLENEIARRTQECLENLGLFMAARRDLQQRTDLAPDGTAKKTDSEILAEIGAWKITRSDWERALQEQVEASLGMLGGNLEPGELQKRKKAMLERLHDPATFAEQFQQFVLRELLYREAREQKLAEKPEFIAFMRISERQFLEQNLLSALPVAEVTQAELQSYYDSHADEFKKEDKVQPFSEVEAQIRAQLQSQKRQQAQEKFFTGLIDKYDVVFHTSKLPEAPAPQQKPETP
ncbi:MAG: peptidylprolyl isomerase [Lentisphaeria bacterium]|nr:peptidylprolyl isomerase [Lentisphaeria bacterium]